MTRPWKPTADQAAMLKQCDPGIRKYVRMMLAGGFNTVESCQGGPGHPYKGPWIAFAGGRDEGQRALRYLLSRKFKEFMLQRVWIVMDRELCRTGWEVYFRTKR